MLINQTTEKLRSMRLPAFAIEFLRQIETPGMSELSFDERIGMMVDAEWFSREQNRIKKLTKEAKLRISDACFADIDYRASRKLDRAYIARLSDFAWVREAKNLIITGATGTGKTWLSCAFGTEACRMGLHVVFYRLNLLLSELAVASGSGNLMKMLTKLKKSDILIIDDWGLSRLNPAESRFLLEIFEARFNESSTIISAQVPVSKWHELFDDATIADAVLDRIVHNSHRFELHGESLRRQAAAQNKSDISPDITPASPAGGAPSGKETNPLPPAAEKN